ncbi:MAG: serine/threonine-protein kinase [Candidatus Sumerlaeia bacterium]|nr:serine/threonine-protein kinase [Candidatus Sumerlaeia bacterium]
MANDETMPIIADLEIQELIGEGGMGSVYKGYQPLLDRTVAVKFVNTRNARNPQQTLERFRREARILASLNHPNIVGCHNAGITEGDEKFYIVMEYVNGPDFGDFLDTHGALAPTMAIKIIRDVADALRYAHEHQIIHRDIKPANILLQSKEGSSTSITGLPYTPKLADLGLAKYAEAPNGQTELTAMGTVMGSPVYMAPEQIENPDAVDFRADIYALGCVLYHALTGRRPFPQSTVTDVIHQKLSLGVPNPSDVSPDLSPGLVELIKQMTAKSAGDRPDSYEQLIQNLDKHLKGDAMTIKPEQQNTPKRSGFSGLLNGLVATIGILMAVIGILASQSGGGESDPAKQEQNVVASAENESVPSTTKKAEPQPTPAPSPTPEPTPIPIPTIDKTIWNEDGIALFNQDYLTRLEGWNTPESGSFGAAEDSTGILGTGDEGLLIYGSQPETPWLLLGAFRPLSSEEFGIVIRTVNGSEYRFLIQNLGSNYLVRAVRMDPEGINTAITPGGTYKPTAESESAPTIGFKLAAWGDTAQFQVVTGPDFPGIVLDSAPKEIGIFKKAGVLEALDFSIHHPMVTP